MSYIAITGGSGFVGSAIINELSSKGVGGHAFSRKELKLPDNFRNFKICNIDSHTDYSDGLNNIKCVIHCAARVHMMDKSVTEAFDAYREVNTFGTLNLARQAVRAGVKRFIFISSIKVSGEGTELNYPFRSLDNPIPVDPYGISKYEAEKGLREITKGTNMEVVIIRPTLIYGAGVKANFLNLIKISHLPIPLPFGYFGNKRSMIFLDNLVDLVATCIEHPSAGNKIFLASDGEDVSLGMLITLIRKAMGKSAYLIPVPIIIFNFLGNILGKRHIVNRLVGNLQVDTIDARVHLNWSPPYSLEEGIKATVSHFLYK